MAAIGGFRSDLSITRRTDGNFGNVSAGVLFPKSRINENGGNRMESEPCFDTVQFSSVHLFAFMNFNFTNYNDKHVFGRQSRKLFCLFKGLP